MHHPLFHIEKKRVEVFFYYKSDYFSAPCSVRYTLFPERKLNIIIIVCQCYLNVIIVCVLFLYVFSQFRN